MEEKTPIVEEEKPDKTKKSILLPLVFVVLFIASVFGVYYLQQSKVDEANDKTAKVEKFASSANQACYGVGAGLSNLSPFQVVTLNATQQQHTNDADGKTATYKCDIGHGTKEATEGMDVAEIDKNGFPFGAEVIYFKDQAAADHFADTKINPQRYWSVPNDELMTGVPTWKYFNSYVFGSPVYFDAYAVKNNIYYRVTLPCGMADQQKTDSSVVDKCVGSSVDGETAANVVLKAFIEKVEANPF